MTDIYDRVMFGVSGTPGTGTITVGAAERSATNGDFLTPAEAGVPDGAVVSYVITDGHNFGKGRRGVIGGSGTTLARDASEVSWNGSGMVAGKLNCTSAAKVFIVALGADEGGLVKLGGGAVTSAVSSVDITDGLTSDFEDFELRLYKLQVSGAANVYLRVSSDGGASFDTSSTYSKNGAVATTNLPIADSSLGTGSGEQHQLSGIIKLSRVTQANATLIVGNLYRTQTANYYATDASFFGAHTQVIALNALRLVPSTGSVNISNLTWKLYGVKK